MKQLNVYLAFDGQCEEALNFYKNCFGGSIEFLQRYGESPMDVAPEHKNRVMHAQFKGNGIDFMASDQMPGQPLTGGNQVSLSINLDDENEQTAIFDRLAAGGQVTMPLQDTFWGARFGMLTDKFGICWMTNCDKK